SERFILPIRLNDCIPSSAYERLGKLHWIDIFPKREYQNGLKKILKAVSPTNLLLRSEPMLLTKKEVHDLIRKHDFFDSSRNLLGIGFPHEYKISDINGDSVVFDSFSCLMWQQSGSLKSIEFEDTQKYIDEINMKNFANFSDWRLPTIEEAMSLMEPEEKNDLYIDPIFDSKQRWIWTADILPGKPLAWIVFFKFGDCSCTVFDFVSSVRAVRSVK
ncbi:MAG TPA: DUF1566 domain-containing protein, partial [bacterium]